MLNIMLMKNLIVPHFVPLKLWLDYYITKTFIQIKIGLKYFLYIVLRLCLLLSATYYVHIYYIGLHGPTVLGKSGSYAEYEFRV